MMLMMMNGKQLWKKKNFHKLMHKTNKIQKINKIRYKSNPNRKKQLQNKNKNKNKFQKKYRILNQMMMSKVG